MKVTVETVVAAVIFCNCSVKFIQQLLGESCKCWCKVLGEFYVAVATFATDVPVVSAVVAYLVCYFLANC